MNSSNKDSEQNASVKRFVLRKLSNHCRFLYKEDATDNLNIDDRISDSQLSNLEIAIRCFRNAIISARKKLSLKNNFTFSLNIPTEIKTKDKIETNVESFNISLQIFSREEKIIELSSINLIYCYLCLNEANAAIGLCKRVLGNQNISEENRLRVSLYLVECYFLIGNWVEALVAINAIGVTAVASLTFDMRSLLGSDIIEGVPTKLAFFVNLAAIQFAKGDINSGSKYLNQAVTLVDKQTIPGYIVNLFVYMYLKQSLLF